MGADPQGKNGTLIAVHGAERIGTQVRLTGHPEQRSRASVHTGLRVKPPLADHFFYENKWVGSLRAKIPGLWELSKQGRRIGLKGRVLGFFQENGLEKRHFRKQEGSRKGHGRGRRRAHPGSPTLIQVEKLCMSPLPRPAPTPLASHLRETIFNCAEPKIAWQQLQAVGEELFISPVTVQK